MELLYRRVSRCYELDTLTWSLGSGSGMSTLLQTVWLLTYLTWPQPVIRWTKFCQVGIDGP